MKWTNVVLIPLLWTLTAVPALGQKTVIEKRDDLPRHTYSIEAPAVEVLQDDEALLALGAELKEDFLSDLDAYEIQDNSALQEYYSTLGSVALLNEEWDVYLDYLQKRKALEEKQANLLTMGLLGEALARSALEDPDDPYAALGEKLDSLLAGLPFSVVQDNVEQTKASMEIVSEALILGSIESNFQPALDESGGEMSQDVASTIIGSAPTLRYFIPNRDTVVAVLSTYIDRHQIEKEDIWAERQVILGVGEGQPVVVAVWDSGLDPEIFSGTGQLWVNDDEIAGNGIDDDKNGFVDDVHGIAYDLDSDKTTEILYPIQDSVSVEDEEMLRSQMKGLMDLQANVDSEEAARLRKRLSELDREDVKPFLEKLSLYSNYAHGTHVGGIAAEGNPHARLLGARLTFDHRLVPEEPTLEDARKDAKLMRETIAYFQENGVRAVNMSWGGNLRAIETALEKNNAGGTPEERKALAREIFEIQVTALEKAIQQADDVLFVTSAGNSDTDVNFDEFYPSSFDLPNILSVGAVDQAGDETSFTSLGKVDLYANGFEVESYVPGGVRLSFSGTSMASPQVLNLIAKMLAVKPDLTVAQLRQLILEGADEKDLDGRTIRLLNAKRTMQLVAEV